MQNAKSSNEFSIPMCVTSIEEKVYGRQVLCVMCLSPVAYGE